MTIEQLLNDIASQIETRKNNGQERGHICIIDGRPRVMPHKHTATEHIVLMQLLPVHFRSGFSPEEWNKLSHQIASFIGRLKL